jgi:alpha-1,2-mannosyltransferase
MSRRAANLLFALLLLSMTAAWVRSAWVMPLRNYAYDFSINYTGARLLSVVGDDGPLYHRPSLAKEAAPYQQHGGLYTKLFLTYIQTPMTAVITLPVSRLPFEASRAVFLSLSNVMLVAAAALMVYALRPSRLLVGATFIIFGTYEAMFDSLRLGQVDGIIVLALVTAFVLLRRNRHPLLGAPLALAAILKLSPVLLIGYFAWRRAWRVVAVAAGSLALLAGVSVVVAGWENNVTFVRDTMPPLMKGSTFYDNISLSGAVARAHFGRDSWFHEDEVPDWPPALRVGMLALNAAIVLACYAVARNDEETGFMLTLAAAILISPVAWSFYPLWLLPSFLWLIRRYEDRRAWGSLALFAVLYPLIAVVPAHFQELDVNLYAYPIKTVVLACYAVLLAMEARFSRPDAEIAGGQRSNTLAGAGAAS